MQIAPPPLEGVTPQEEEAPAVLNKKQEMIQKIIEIQSVINDALRSKSLDNLYAFNKHVLGVEAGKVPLASFHRELCTFVQDNRHKKKLILVPRGHLKSTLITIGYSTQQIVKNPNIRILILNATWQMAVDFLTEIKRNLTANEKLVELFGNVAANPTEWAQDRITLQRTDKNIKGPTVWATGIDSNLVGSHPDLIIFDDVVNRDNTKTREQIDKVILRYKDALDLLEPGGQLIVIGTRWNEEDLYGWILNPDNNVKQSYDVFHVKAYEGNIETGENFAPLWTDKFDQKELLTRLREKGWYEFSSQYLNDPVPPQDATFKKVDFRYYDREDIRGKQMNKILTIDPAISEKKSADFTAMVGSGLDVFSNLFILALVRAHLSPKQIIDKIFDLQEVHHFHQIGIETIAYQKALAYMLQEEMRSRKRYLPLVEIKSQDQSKDQRIKGLQPLYETHKVYHLKEDPVTPYLEDELLKFPRSSHDDLSDAFSMQLPFLYPPRQKKERYRASYLY